MSMGSLGGIAGSAAGSPLAQTTGSDVERVKQDAGVQKRRDSTDEKAEAASGIGEADGEDHETAERDADGRRLWEEVSAAKQETSEDAGGDRRKSKDSSGQSGNLLDLSG